MGVATVFEVEVPASTLALADTFERAPEAEFRMERTVGSADHRTMPFVWISGVESDRISGLLAADRSVAGAEKLGEDEDAHLFEVRFDGGICEFVEPIFEGDGVVIRANATDGVWTLQLRFTDHSDVGEVFDDEFCRKYEATVTRLYGSNDAPVVRSGLTDKQRQALRLAFDEDYYDVPRTVDLREVGDRLGISRQAVSERLRRAHEVLVADFFGESNER
jgi:predicted DNA binding protein